MPFFLKKYFNLHFLHSLETLIYSDLAVETSGAGEPVYKYLYLAYLYYYKQHQVAGDADRRQKDV